MTAESQPAADAAPSDTGDGGVAYQAWVRVRFDLPADALVIERPAPDAIARIEAARCAGATKVITGFLPDEIDWPEPGWNDLLAWFVEHMTFVPRQLAAAGRVPAERPQVLLVTDEFPEGESRSDGAEALANACAQAIGWQLESLSIDGSDEVALAPAVAAAGFVINDSADWSLGFAIDELAARGGIRCVRLRNPGYSLLRYALLDRELPAETSHDVPRLRSLLLDAGWPQFDAAARSEAAAWFDGVSTVEFWRHVFAAESFQGFWRNWPGFHGPLPTHPDASRWMNRAVAWSALHAAFVAAEFSESARLRAGRTLAGWLAAEHKQMVGGRVSDAGGVRWVVRHPDWVAQYESSAVGVRSAKSIVTWWATIGSQHVTTVAEMVALANATSWALESPGPELAPMLTIRAWAEQWSEVPARSALLAKVSDRDRCWCFEAFWTACEAASPEVTAGNDALWLRPDGWHTTLGPAGCVAWLRAALRGGGLRARRAAWRFLLEQLGLGGVFGLARFARSGFSDPANFHAWLKEGVRTIRLDLRGKAEACVSRWWGGRAFDLWVARPEFQSLRELRIAARILARLAVRAELSARSQRLRVIFESLAGNADGCRASLADVPGAAPDRIELLARASVGLWLRGVRSTPEELLEDLELSGVTEPKALFTCAVAWQVLGRNERVTTALERLRQVDAGFLADSASPARDTRWAWAALVFRRVGDGARAAGMLTKARERMPGSERLFADVPAANPDPATPWVALVEAAR